MMGGQAPDQRWYWDGKAWNTDLKAAPVPRTIAAFRPAFAAALAQPRAGLEPTALCQARATPYQITPTLTVGNGTLARGAGDTRNFRASPEIDGATLAIALGLVGEMGLGKGAATDVLSVGLSGTDYVGHSYGSGGQEMCLQMLGLDRELDGFFAALDAAKIDYAVVLSADHGGLDLVERLRAGGVSDAQRLDPDFTVREDRQAACRADRAERAGAARRVGRGRVDRQEPVGRRPPHRRGRRDRHRQGASAGRDRVHRRRDGRDPDAERRSVPVDASPAVSGELRSGAVGRPADRAQEPRTRRSRSPASAMSRATDRRGITTAACQSSSGAPE